jgi:hypothetical protein
LTEQEKQTVNELTAKLTTHCVGRYQIDVPADVLVAGNAQVAGVDVDSKAMPLEEYRNEIAARQTELRDIKSADGYPFLYADGEASGKDTRYFIYRGKANDDPGRRYIEAYKWDLGYRIKLTIEGHDFTHPDQTSDPIVQQFSVRNDTPAKTRLVLNLIERVRGRQENDVPTEPGLCFTGGFLSGKAGEKEEVTTLFVPAANRDVTIVLESGTGRHDTRSLLQRRDEIEPVLSSLPGARTIRKGKLSLDGINADEWLMTLPSDLGAIGNKFMLEANTTTDIVQAPFISVTLETAEPNAFFEKYKLDKASLTEGEAVALWDAVSRTLRPRPNAY